MKERKVLSRVLVKIKGGEWIPEIVFVRVEFFLWNVVKGKAK